MRAQNIHKKSRNKNIEKLIKLVLNIFKEKIYSLSSFSVILIFINFTTSCQAVSQDESVNGDIVGPGLDLFLLIDVSLSSFPSNDSILSNYRINIIEEVIDNLRPIWSHGDRIGIYVFADDIIKILPTNKSYLLAGYGESEALKTDIINNVRIYSNDNRREINRTKTNIPKALNSIYEAIKKQSGNPNRSAQKRPPLILLVSDGVNDPLNDGKEAKNILNNENVIIARIIDVREALNAQVAMIHLPANYDSLGIFEYRVSDKWKRILGEKGLIAPLNRETMAVEIERAFRYFRLFNPKQVIISADNPFFISRSDSLKGNIFFKVPELSVNCFRINLEIDSLIWKASHSQSIINLNLTDELKKLFNRQIVLNSNSECSINFSTDISKLTKISPDVFGRIIYKLVPTEWNPPFSPPECLTFTNISQSNIVVKQSDMNPYASVIKINLKKEDFHFPYGLTYFWFSVLIPIPFILIKIMSYIRYHKGKMNYGKNIKIKLKNPDIKITGGQLNSRDKCYFVDKAFNGILKCSFEFGSDPSYQGYLNFRPFGEESIVIEKQIIYRQEPDVQLNPPVSQTYLSKNGEEIASEKKILPENRACVVSIEEMKKNKNIIHLCLHPAEFRLEKDKKDSEISLEIYEYELGHIKRYFSKLLDYRTAKGYCRIEKIASCLSLFINLVFFVYIGIHWREISHEKTIFNDLAFFIITIFLCVLHVNFLGKLLKNFIKLFLELVKEIVLLKNNTFSKFSKPNFSI